MPPKVPISWKKTKEIVEKLGYIVSDEPVEEEAFQVDDMYVDKDGNLVVITDE